ncbi:MAG: hypothetical protein LKE37_09545 [Atopobiaceae bacterium]|nr:hypothetical protein [Atopobiaceae bacterium]
MSCAASGRLIISLESAASATLRQTRKREFAAIWSETTPVGFWVASTRCTPRERPMRAAETSPSMKSGSCALSSANSSATTNRCGMGSATSPAA